MDMFFSAQTGALKKSRVREPVDEAHSYLLVLITMDYYLYLYNQN